MGSKISVIRCETLGRLDSGALPACNGFASLRRISITCDGIHAVSGTNDKEFEYLLIPSHPRLFGFLLPDRARTSFPYEESVFVASAFAASTNRLRAGELWARLGK